VTGAPASSCRLARSMSASPPRSTVRSIRMPIRSSQAVAVLTPIMVSDGAPPAKDRM
jgi:hypothetical protein